MNGSSPPLPKLGLGDFGPTQFHVAEASLQDKVFAILHRDDPARGIIPRLQFPADDDYRYVFVHGGDEVTRFQNLQAAATHEISAPVIAELLRNYYGNRLAGTPLRICSCYGNLLRPGDRMTAVQTLAVELLQCRLEGYHGLIRLRAHPSEIRLGASVRWDPLVGPVVIGPPGAWELVIP